MVARATASQFNSGKFDIVRVPYISSAEQIIETLAEAAKHSSVVCHTLVSPELRKALLDEAGRLNIVTVDIMGPMIQAIQGVSGLTPKLKPGLIHTLDQDYFKRVCAVLNTMGIAYKVDPLLVRGLDYYVHTVFEVTHSGLGAQNAISGGGRYELFLPEENKPMLGVGFGIGLERLLMVQEAL